MPKANQQASNLVVVTGASRGLGLELVRQLARSGAEVIAACREPERFSTAGMDGQITPIACDVTDADIIARMAAALAGRPLDMLINNAGIRGATDGLDTVEAEDFLSVMAVNVLGPLLVTRALLPNLRLGRGLVANISSRAGSMAEGADPDGDYAYKCSKAALNMATVKLADDTGLTVLSLHPGWIKTDMGGEDAELAVRDSATALLALLAKADHTDSGTFRSYDGATVAW